MPFSSTSTQAAVIGSGIAGLAAAIRLAVKGYSVTVFEANNYVGGKLSQFTKEGFRFDAGPSLFTLPTLVDELFTLAGRTPKDYFRYQRLTEITQYFWPDGTELTAYAEPEHFAREAEKKLGVRAEKVLAYFQQAARMYEATEGTFLRKSLHRLQTYLSKDVLKTVSVLGELGLFSTMHEANAAAFPDTPKLVQLLDRFATYNGSSPYLAPATLNLIGHLEHGLGAYYPEGGMHSITKALHRLALELGVTFRMQESVLEIMSEGKHATGVRTEKGVFQAEVVVSNMDVVPTYRKLLPKHKAPERTLNQPRSSSALIFYWGISCQFPQLGLHNIFFSSEYQQEFEAIFQQQTVYADPTVYVNITSKLSPDDAPAGCGNWFVMVNVPANSGQDWKALIQQTRESVISKLSHLLKVDLRTLIVTEAILDPAGIEARTSSHLGALYGASSNNRLAAFLRHPNFKSGLGGLYFCGGSVHPGGGIPLCLLSARIATDLVPAVS